MLGVVSRGAMPVSYVERFRELAESGRVSSTATSRGHKDGWGIVHLGPTPVCLGRRAADTDGVEADASRSTGYLEACRRLEALGGGILLVHLRRASRGAKTHENTPPLIDGGWCFSHNGTIHGLGSDVKSDSREFFELILRHILGRRDVLRGLRAAVEEVRAKHGYTSLTFLLSDGGGLYAYRDYTKDGDYYSLLYAELEGVVLIAQEELWGLKWRNIPDKSIIRVSRDLKIEGPTPIASL